MLKLEPDEKIILETEVQVDPGYLTTKEYKLYITNKRAYVDLEAPAQIPFESIKNLNKKRWMLANSIITISYTEAGIEKQIKFNATRGGITINSKTNLAYETLEKILRNQQPDSEKIAKEKIKEEKIKKDLIFDFTSLLGWPIFAGVIAGVVLGGAIGTIIGFLTARIIQKIGKRTDYSTGKKVTLAILTVIGGIALYLVLVTIFYIILYSFFPDSLQ